MITMKGKLVTLEPLDINKHVSGYYAISQDEAMYQYLGNPIPKSVDEVIELFSKYQHYFMNWMIVSNETKEVIGIIRLSKPSKENGIVTAGESEMLSSKYWRKGYMKEVKQLFYEYVFNTLSVEVLYADVWEGNINSIKSLEYYGYQLIDTTKEVFSKTNELRTKYIYVLYKNDYVNQLGK